MTSQLVLVRVGGVVAPRSDLRLGLASASDWDAKAFLPLPASLKLKSKIIKDRSSPIELPTFFHILLLENLA